MDALDSAAQAHPNGEGGDLPPQRAMARSNSQQLAATGSSPQQVAQGRGRGAGRGLAREARRRSIAGGDLRRVFACQALNGPAAAALPWH